MVIVGTESYVMHTFGHHKNLYVPCIYIIHFGSNLKIVFLRASSLDFVVPDGLPFTSSSSVKRQLKS